MVVAEIVKLDAAAVIPKGPTIIGEDPYNSIQPILRAIPKGKIEDGTVKRATRAAPIRIGSERSPVELKVPDPIEFPELD